MVFMPKHTIGNYPTADPYCLLALSVLEEAFRTIKCYFLNKGTEEELEEGKRALRWIMKMQGNFKVIAGASGKSLERFHQLCIWKINKIKSEAYHERQAIQEKSSES